MERSKAALGGIFMSQSAYTAELKLHKSIYLVKNPQIYGIESCRQLFEGLLEEEVLY